MEFQSATALRAWVKSHRRGILSVIRPGQLPLVLDPTHYDCLDPEAVYSISATFHQQGIFAVKHNQGFDKAWENRCRLKLNDWFEEQGIYVVEMERLVHEPGSDASPAAEWEGMWKGLDGTVYLLECKYNMTAVYSALLRRLLW
jgi:hypothetical protein